MLRDPRFWGIQAVVGAFAAIHDLTDQRHAISVYIHLLPVSLFWLPLVYSALVFRIAGPAVTSGSVVLASLHNWLLMTEAHELSEEIMLVAIAAAISIMLGWQVDHKLRALSNAEAYAAYAVRSQEAERKRLSFDLHDDPVQTLTAVCHELDSVKDISSSSQQRLVEARSLVGGVVQRLRDLSVALRPSTLDDMGVVSAIRGLLADSAEKGGFAGQLDVAGEQRRLPPDMELAIFRIAQEALRNITRHAMATQVRVGIVFAAKEVRLEIVDNGNGFDVSAFRDRGHLGLLSMKARAEMVGGRFELSSKPGKGARIVTCFPLSSR